MDDPFSIQKGARNSSKSQKKEAKFSNYMGDRSWKNG